MLDAGRTAVMARDCSGPKWGPADHFEATGFDTTGIPSRLLEGRYKMSKEWGAELVYAAMLAAHESQPGEPGRLPPDVEAVAYAIWLYEDAALMYADVQDPRDIPAESLKYCREKWLKDWLPALHENHFGDCIKVCTACTRCHMERLVGEASLLLAKSPPADTTPDVSEGGQWHLWLCNQEPGHAVAVGMGTEEAMRERLNRMAAIGMDVWLIDSHGNKHMPTDNVEGE